MVLNKTNQTVFSELIAALSLMMDLDENNKLYHAWRVAAMAAKMAERFLPEEKRNIFYAGLLHDIGGIALPDHIIHYRDLEEQFENPIIKTHPQKGAYIIRQIPSLAKSSEMVMDHHEMWDGSGYPQNKKGSEISVGGQILRIADTFDLVSRDLKKPTISEVSSILRNKIGSEFSREIYFMWKKTVYEEGFFNMIRRNDTLPQLVNSIIETLPETEVEIGSDVFETIVKVFAEVVDAKHTYTAGHSRRVAEYSSKIAEAVGLSEGQVKAIKYAGYLHDAGKVAIPRRILDKKQRLSENEFELIKKHPVYTMEILSLISQLNGLITIAGYHHERYDGLGYPNGLRGDRIPLGARIMAIADAYDAMTSLRPYQEIRSPDEAKEVLLKNAGSQFDPKLVEPACDVL
ncbi:MAG: HD domain-containing protein [Firmicutes bacterium]|nr:HD domain-containing protein [Bacillota bacterium]